MAFVGFTLLSASCTYFWSVYMFLILTELVEKMFLVVFVTAFSANYSFCIVVYVLFVTCLLYI